MKLYKPEVPRACRGDFLLDVMLAIGGRWELIGDIFASISSAYLQELKYRLYEDSVQFERQLYDLHDAMIKLVEDMAEQMANYITNAILQDPVLAELESKGFMVDDAGKVVTSSPASVA